MMGCWPVRCEYGGTQCQARATCRCACHAAPHADREYRATPFYVGEVAGYSPGYDPMDKPEGDGGPKFVHKYHRKRRINLTGCLVFILFVLSLGFYLWVRITKTLGLGKYLWYGILVLIVEILGGTTTLLYGA
jgi:hypothetical protein